MKTRAYPSRGLMARSGTPPVVTHEVVDDRAYLLTEGLPGVRACHPPWADPLEEMIERVAGGLRSWHEQPSAGCPIDRSPWALLAIARERVEAGVVDPATFEPHHAGRTPQQILGRLEHRIPERYVPTLVHGDFSLTNILIDGDDVDFVDLDRGGLGDRHLDLAIAARSLTYNWGEQWVPLMYGITGNSPTLRELPGTASSTNCSEMTLALTFDNRFTTELVADPSDDPTSRQVTGASFSRVTPRAPSAPQVLAVSAEMLEALGIDPEDGRSPEFAHVFTGGRVPDGADPHAAAYGGHQFGNWAGQLGDGRAISLGSAIAADGSRLELQLKGAGPTPYSRRADGLAVLRSSLREFVCSEAMHHLGVPTTRALSLALTGDMVMRDMFYDGNPEWEPGAVVCRVAPSFIRFGNFQLHTWRNEIDHLRALADHTIRHHFPELAPGDVAGMYAEVVRRTARLMVEWARVGFVHGVMNTDNMSILGLTIDYGPYGWLEGYDPAWTPNTTDAQGRRYRFGNQPAIAQWNLAQLGNALVPLLDSPAPLQEALDGFVTAFESGWQSMMASKLGLDSFDQALVDSLLALLGMAETDMTIFFRKLSDVTSPEMGPLEEAHYSPPSVEARVATQAWLARWLATVAPAGRARMNSVNPKYVFRNYLAQEAIDLATAGDPTRIHQLLDVLGHPYDEQSGNEPFAARRPEWARVKPGCSMLSCSS